MTRAKFVEPMLLLKTDTLPEGVAWRHELKMDGYRAIAYKSGGTLKVRSRNDKDFAIRYPDLLQGLARLPDESIIDGEIVALDEDGKPSFSALQNYGSAPGPMLFFAFDVLMLAGKDLRAQPLTARLDVLHKKIAPKLKEPVRVLGAVEGRLRDLIASVKAHGFSPAKRRDIFKKLDGLGITECPFANLPEAQSGRWGAGLTKAKMADCRWLKPVMVGQFEFLEWTGENHLRHSKFVALRDDKKAKDVKRE